MADRSARLLTVVTGGTAFCAGEHPYHGGRAVTLDARTGRTGDVRRVFPGLTDGRLRALSLRGYPHREDDCREQVQDQVPEVYPTPAGLVLWQPQLAYAVYACNELVTVPYSTLKSDLDPRGPYWVDFGR